MKQPTMSERSAGYRLSQRLQMPLSDFTVDEWFGLAAHAEAMMGVLERDDGGYGFHASRRDDCLAAASFVERFPGVTPR